MAKVLTIEQAGTALIYFVCSAAAVIAGPHFGGRLIYDPQATAAMRYLGVAISVVSIVPFLGYVGWGFWVADEYNRRTMLIGTAVAFALAILFSLSAELLADAHLVGAVVTINLPIGLVLWMIGLGLAALAVRLRPAL